MPNETQTEPGDDTGDKQYQEPNCHAPCVSPAANPGDDGRIDKPNGAAADADSSDQDEKKRQGILERSANWQAWCAIAIAVFTAAQVVVGYWQWRATDKQYDAMIRQIDEGRRAHRQQLRAHMLIDVAETSNLASDDPTTMTLTAKNVGQSPAYKVLFRASVRTTKVGVSEPYEPVETDDPHSRASVGPGGTIHLPIKLRFPLAQKVAIVGGQYMLWVYGEVRYTDVFGCEHQTKFRFFGGGPNGFPGGALLNAVTGNDAISLGGDSSD